MTIPTLPSVAKLSAPLAERTNQSTEVDTPSGREQDSINPKPNTVHLYHTQSFRNLAHCLDSSETPPSQHSSIYDAETILSEEPYPRTEIPSHEEWSQPDESPPLAFFAADQNSELRPPHSRWPVSQLEPIIERRSTPQLRKFNSVPRLQPGPERNPTVVRSQASSHSIHILRSNTEALPISSKQAAPRFRSFSLNDLDCFPRSDIRQIVSANYRDSSLSSEEAFHASCLQSPFPLKPVYSPPYRSPTPPGLPSFSTREAQQYRLTTPASSSRVIAFIQRWLGRNYDENDEWLPDDVVRPPRIPSTHAPAYSPPMTVLKRVLGTPYVVEHLPPRTMNPRASLPARIRVATNPGDLIQADDGTMVRGRWGSRSSAHGVGQRALDSHPLTQVAGLHTIDEVVSEIDKACEMAEEEHRQRQVLSTQIPTEAPLPAVSHNTLEMDSSQNHRVTEASPMLRSLSPQNSCPQQTQINWQPTFTSERVRSPSSSLVSPTQPRGVHGQPRYYATMAPSMLSTHSDGVAGFDDQIQRRARAQAGQDSSFKKEISRCKNCWKGFWIFCCCPKRKDTYQCEAE